MQQPLTGYDTALAERKQRIQSILDAHPFAPTWWLRGQHFQTIVPAYFRGVTPIAYRRERLETPDDDFLDVGHYEGDPNKPLVVTLHGLEGSPDRRYMVGLNHELHALGFNVVNMAHRSCWGEMNRARRMYHSGETSDLAFLVDTLIKRHPGKRIYVAGYSLGANVTAKWLGTLGDEVPEAVRGAAVVSAPYDLMVSGPHVDRQIFGLYVKKFLRTLIPKALAKEKQYPGCVDVEKVMACRTFRDFDTYATAALHGFRDAEDYWAKVACGQFLPGVRRMTMLLSSADDPFNPGSTLPYDLAAQSPWLVPQFTERGGHVGFMEGSVPGRFRYWVEAQIARFFAACEEEGV